MADEKKLKLEEVLGSFARDRRIQLDRYMAHSKAFAAGPSPYKNIQSMMVNDAVLTAVDSVIEQITDRFSDG